MVCTTWIIIIYSSPGIRSYGRQPSHRRCTQLQNAKDHLKQSCQVSGFAKEISLYLVNCVISLAFPSLTNNLSFWNNSTFSILSCYIMYKMALLKPSPLKDFSILGKPCFLYFVSSKIIPFHLIVISRNIMFWSLGGGRAKTQCIAGSIVDESTTCIQIKES